MIGVLGLMILVIAAVVIAIKTEVFSSDDADKRLVTAKKDRETVGVIEEATEIENEVKQRKSKLTGEKNEH